ncbi:MAG: hypothetical protein WAL50_08770, partial [Kineosporiaceae bacterium]
EGSDCAGDVTARRVPVDRSRAEVAGLPGPWGTTYARPVPEDFLIARNPEPGSTLPYLIRVPLGPGPAPAGDRRRLPRAPRGREPVRTVTRPSG